MTKVKMKIGILAIWGLVGSFGSVQAVKMRYRNDTVRAQAQVPVSSWDLSTLSRPEQCPPCFNCLLPAFTCGQFGECNPYDGQCKCPPGWSGIDCLVPQCDSLADGEHRRPREDGQTCDCKEGWGGVNCNVCKTNNACANFRLPGDNFYDGDDEDQQANMTCYKGGETVFNNHQMCDVTNRKILDQVGEDRPVQVTFSCDNTTMPASTSSATCSFQFWVDQKESFYCGLEECTSERKPGYEGSSDQISYRCNTLKCKCVPGRFICGEDGSVDISDFLKEEIKGPASFSCLSSSSKAPSDNSTLSFSGTAGSDSLDSCKFEEPAMNGLISDVFGDPYITLDCFSGECLHYSQIPGYVRPLKPDNTFWVLLSCAAALLIVLQISFIIWYSGRNAPDSLPIKLPPSESAKLMAEHVPASLSFSGIGYELPNGRQVLSDIQGSVRPGEVMAIMGASGAGKSTLLDILARKNKRGLTRGEVLINGREVKDEEFKSVMGYVDQEDTLMGTLTVYESVLYSALLRLPREMSEEAKKFRVLETLEELGILGIKDYRIGESGKRSISGGEKRRVSIACELVTSPSILFLDEPTSGLDSYNAFNVVESLVNLARNYKRTVIFTIHQPRSNIVALFDQLVLLAMGKLVYSGPFANGRCFSYFEEKGWKCPEGFNMADFLIDLTMNADRDTTQSSSASVAERENDHEGDSYQTPTTPSGNYGEEEQGLLHGDHPNNVRLNTVRSTPSSTTTTRVSSYIRRKASDIFRRGEGSSREAEMKPKLASLVEAYKDSDIAKGLKEEREEMKRAAASTGTATPHSNGGHGAAGAVSSELPDVAVETQLLRGRKRASWGTQFRILSGRAFKNLYRDPALLTAHYVSSIALALFCGFFFRNVSDDISGFQNRLGLFFFTLALFGFSCLSSLGLFANERILFMRERANGYYSSFTYFSSKILFDILPLRFVPPLLFGGIIYGLVGLVPTVPAFWKFLLVLVLFNLTTASVVLWLSIAFANTSVASLVGTLIMLYNLLFTGLLINRESVHPFLQWLHTISFFHAAFEALAVNELRYLHLKEFRYGVELDVPAAMILSVFGLRVQSFWWPNVALLAIFFAVFTTASYLTLHYFVKEKR